MLLKMNQFLKQYYFRAIFLNNLEKIHKKYEIFERISFDILYFFNIKVSKKRLNKG